MKSKCPNLDSTEVGGVFKLAPLLMGVSSEPVLAVMTEKDDSLAQFELTWHGVFLDYLTATKVANAWNWS